MTTPSAAMSLFSSLTNRIFFGSALLAVASIAIAIYNVNVAVTRQAEQELRRGLDEAGTIIEEYRRVLVDHFTREARLIADLPRLKAAVDTNHPTTVLPMAEEYQRQLSADLLLITGRQGQTLAEITSASISSGSFASLPGIKSAQMGRESGSFWPHPGGILQVVTVPIFIDLQQPEILGTLSVGVSLDNAMANRFHDLTNSDIAFGLGGTIRSSTLPQQHWPALTPLLGTVEPLAERSGWQRGLHRQNESAARGSADSCRIWRDRSGRSKRHHPAVANRAPGFSESSARPAGHHRRRRRAGGDAPELCDRAHRHAAARRHYRDHARDGRDRRPDPTHCRAARRRRVGRRGRPAPGEHVQHDDRLDRAFPARGGATRAALVARAALDRRRARNPQPLDDHQDRAQSAPRRRTSSPTNSGRPSPTSTRKPRASTAWCLRCSTLPSRSSSSWDRPI